MCLHTCVYVSLLIINCHSTRMFDVCERANITFYQNKSNKYWFTTWSFMLLVKTTIAINKKTALRKGSSVKLYVKFMKREIWRESLHLNYFSRPNANSFIKTWNQCILSLSSTFIKYVFKIKSLKLKKQEVITKIP